MRELNNLQGYKTIDFSASFPWAHNGSFAISPGQVEIIRRLLKKVESIAGRDALLTNLRFIRIKDTEEIGLRIYIDIADMSESCSSAIQEAVIMTIETSHHICVFCGKQIKQRERYCPQHVKQKLLFSNDAKGKFASTDDLTNQPELNIVYAITDAVKTGRNDLSFEQIEQPEAPVVSVFSLADVLELEKSGESKESDSRDRIRGVVKKLRNTSEQKPLAMLRKDWRGMLDQFDIEFPNFSEFIEFLRDQFALADLGDKRISIPPVLFNGPPGIGKTEVALSFASLIDTDAMEVDMAVAQSASALSGSDAFYSNTREGRLFEVLAFGRTANPIVFLDELDKISCEERYRPDAALYQLLEPRTAESFRDLSIREVKLNASHVLWFAATNDLARVSQPIRSRFTVFNIPTPTKQHSVIIAHAIYKRIINRNSWGKSMSSDISDDVALCVADLPPRMMRTQLTQACGRAARLGRRTLEITDICFTEPAQKSKIGFVHL